MLIFIMAMQSLHASPEEVNTPSLDPESDSSFDGDIIVDSPQEVLPSSSTTSPQIIVIEPAATAAPAPPKFVRPWERSPTKMKEEQADTPQPLCAWRRPIPIDIEPTMEDRQCQENHSKKSVDSMPKPSASPSENNSPPPSVDLPDMLVPLTPSVVAQQAELMQDLNNMGQDNYARQLFRSYQQNALDIENRRICTMRDIITQTGADEHTKQIVSPSKENCAASLNGWMSMPELAKIRVAVNQRFDGERVALIGQVRHYLCVHKLQKSQATMRTYSALHQQGGMPFAPPLPMVPPAPPLSMVPAAPPQNVPLMPTPHYAPSPISGPATPNISTNLVPSQSPNITHISPPSQLMAGAGATAMMSGPHYMHTTSTPDMLNHLQHLARRLTLTPHTPPTATRTTVQASSGPVTHTQFATPLSAPKLSTSLFTDSAYYSGQLSMSSQNDSAYSSGTDLTPPQQAPVAEHQSGGRRKLSPESVHMMEEWYSANRSHPYPTSQVVRAIACRGSITIGQVRKWMANKRLRQSNTLPHNNSIHPRRLRRMQRILQEKMLNS